MRRCVHWGAGTAAVTCVGLVLALAPGLGSCGATPTSERQRAVSSASEESVAAGVVDGGHTTSTDSPFRGSAATVPAAPSRVASWAPPDPEIASAFESLEETAGIAVYAPTDLPADQRLASDSAFRSLTLGPDSVARVLMHGASSWLLVMEGMQGDVGDLPGEECGLVGHRPARAYGVLGGDLVQWSDAGVWYGVYGLGMARDDIIRVAHGMVLRAGAG
jgi:hypothetical protein